MPRWFKTKSEQTDPKSSDRDDHPQAKFRLESLEPRILLSGDPVLAELARLSQPDTQPPDEPAALVEVIELATASPQASDNDQLQAPDSDASSVSWPAGWPTANPDSAIDADAIVDAAADATDEIFQSDPAAVPIDLAAMPVTELDPVDAGAMADAIAADNVALQDLNPDFEDLAASATTEIPTALVSISNAAGDDLNSKSDPVANPILDRTDVGTATDLAVVYTPAAMPQSADSAAPNTRLPGIEIGSDLTTDSSNTAQQDDATDIVVGLFATAQQARETARNELRRTVNNGHENRNAGAPAGARASQSQIPLSQEIHNESLARAPPFIAEVQTVSAISEFNTIREERVAPAFAAPETPNFPDIDNELPSGPAGEDAQPRAPPSQPEPLDYLLVDGDPMPVGSADTLTAGQLDAIFQAALQIWSDFLQATGRSGDLSGITIQIADLVGGILGQSQGHAITIDSTAAGYGWFVDATPQSNSEFDGLGIGQLTARAGSSAADRIDLLTVVLHEIGHVLDFDHGLTDPYLMNDTLADGQRLTLETVQRVPQIAVDFGGISIVVNDPTVRADLVQLLTSPTMDQSLEFTAEIQINQFVYLIGTFEVGFTGILEVDIATGLPANITDLLMIGAAIEDVPVSAWTFSATNVYAFVGLNGPYVSDTNGNGVIDTDEAAMVNDDAVGLSIENLDIGGVLMQLTGAFLLPEPYNVIPKFWALKATVESAGLVGLEGILEASLINVLIEVNNGDSWPGDLGPPVVNFKQSFETTAGANDGSYSVGDIEIDFDGNQRIGAAADTALLQLSQFVHVIGSMSFQKGPTHKVDVATGLPANLGDLIATLSAALGALLDADPGDGTLWIEPNFSTIHNLEVDSLQVGISGAHVFVGLNGPYVSDANNNGIIDGDEQTTFNADAVGLAINDVDFGFVMMAPTLAALPGFDDILPTFYAAQGTAASAGLVGLQGILEASLVNLVVEVNNGDPWPGDLGPPVVDFQTSFSANELLTLFDTTPDGIITVGELRALNGGNAAFSNMGMELYSASALDSAVIDLDVLLSVLDVDGNGLQISEAELLVTVAGAVVLADADNDGKIEPAGYEVRTGTDTASVYIDFDGNQRIGASAENVLLQLSQFVHVVGSLSFQQGPTHKVDVATGLPTVLGDLVGGLLDGVSLLPSSDPGDGTLWIEPNLSTIHNLEVDSLQVGISGAHAFVGLNGPVQLDADGDGQVTAVEIAAHLALTAALGAPGAILTDILPNAFGLDIADLNFGFVMMKPTLAALPGFDDILPTFYAMTGNAETIEFVGLPDIVMRLQGIDIAVNNGDPWPGGFGPPVVNFQASFATNELLTLFDTTPDGIITVGELRALNDGNAAFSNMGMELYAASALDSAVIDLDVLLSVLDVDGNGLQVSEAALLVIDTAAIATADADGDGKIEPAGYEVRTGTDTLSLYIDFDGNQRIGASVERATIQISEFVHIVGSIAFEMGPVETVELVDGLLPVSDIVDILVDLGLPAGFIPLSGSVEMATMTIGASDVHAFIGLGGPYWLENYDDVGNHDNVIDPDEINPDAVGLVVDDFDFGLALMTPIILDQVGSPLKFIALRATADGISLEGISDLTVRATEIIVELNFSTPTFMGFPVLPVVNFASSYPDNELLDLFDTNADGVITVGELRLLNGQANSDTGAFSHMGVELYSGTALANTVVDIDLLLAVLDTDSNGLQISEAALLVTDTDAIAMADNDSDGKIEPFGFEVPTGGASVYLGMDSTLIRAQGFLELKILDNLFITGSIAFELGPTVMVTLSDGTEKMVNTMTIGAADVTAFIGSGGPYWTDTGNHIVEPDELNPDSIGFHITDLDVGITLMASLADPGVYLAAKLNVESFGLVGIDDLSASGAFDIELNIVNGLFGFGPSLAVVDFAASFSEVTDLFMLMDTSMDNIIDQAEQNAALASGYVGVDITTAAQLAAILNATNSTAEPDDYLDIDEVLAKLDNGFMTANADAIAGLDSDGNGRLNTGFEVNTGNDAAPVVLEFEQFLISVQLGGQIVLGDEIRLYGVFLFEVDSSGLKAFVAAGLEIGPDIGTAGSQKLFTMHALGALVINDQGLAADIQVSVSVGGALSGILRFEASAWLLINTTGVDQSITIPERYAGFLTTTDDLSASIPVTQIPPIHDISEISRLGLAAALADRITPNPDSSMTFTISGGAPRLDGTTDPDGPFVLVAISGNLTIVNTFVIDAAFHLKISDTGLELGFNGDIDLGGFVTLAVAGGAVIEDNVFAAFVNLDFSVDIPDDPNAVGIHLAGMAGFEINSGAVTKTVLDAAGNPHQINPHTFKVSVAADINLFDVLEATASVVIAVEDGDFSITVQNGSIDFFGILDIEFAGYFNTNGSFSFTGSVELNLTSGGFGIFGDLSVTVSNSGFSGHGGVDLVIAGERIDIASGEISVDWDTGAWRIRAEGPLSVWLEVTSDGQGGYSIDGGIGFFDDVLEALGEVADAIAEGVGIAIAAVEEAFTALNTALVEFGEDVAQFFSDVGDAIVAAAEAVWDEVSGWFEDNRTLVTQWPNGQPTPQDLIDDYYVYSAEIVNGTLTISNGDNGGYAQQLSFYVVGGQLIIDAPDTTGTIVVARSQYQERDYEWDGLPPWGQWGDWYNVGPPQEQTLQINISNARSFDLNSVTKIVVMGTDNDETIVFDRDTINIDTDVHGFGGHDVIVTGTGNDRVWGGTGNDTIFTNEGNDFLWGEEGADKLFGFTGNDYLNGGAGDDLLDENKDRVMPGDVNPPVHPTEINILIGESGKDTILGSPGRDFIDGGGQDDVLVGLLNDDSYIFQNGYGTDQLVDIHGREVLDFSGASTALRIIMSDTGVTASAGTGNFLSIGQLTSVQELRLGSGTDDLYISRLPFSLFTITDAGGRDLVTVDDTADAANNVGVLTSSRLTGLGMGNIDQTVVEPGLGIIYSDIEDLVISLGDGNNIFTINSTHGGGTKTTTLNLGDGTGLVHINNASDTLVVNGQGGVDTFNLNGTSANSVTTLNGGGDDDIFNLRAMNGNVFVNGGNNSDTFNVGSLAPAGNSTLTGIAGLLTINGNDPPTGSDVLNVDNTGDIGRTGTLTDATLTGLGMSGSIAYGTIETLNIGLGAGIDTFTVQSSHSGVTNLNSNDGADIINVQSIGGATTVNTGNGADNVNVGSNALGTTTNRTNNRNGTLNGIAALLTLNGEDTGGEANVLTVDDSADNANNTGVLTGTRLTGLGMGNADQSVVDASLGIEYNQFEQLVISLGIANDTFTIVSTHGAATAARTEQTTLSAGAGDDTVHIDDVRDTLVVNGDIDVDTINVNGTDTISLTTLNGDDGNDIINVRAMNGEVRVNGGANDDTFNVGSLAATLPGVPTVATGTTDQINGLLVVNGTSGDLDVLNVDDSNPVVTNKSGTLTNNRIEGLELEQGVNYSNLDVLNIWLASGENNFVINSTHAGETTVNAAAANDTIDINNAQGLLTVNGEAGMDTINVNNVTGTLVVNGQGDVDTVNVYGTESVSLATLNGDAGNDIFNVRAMSGEVRVNGGANDDHFNIGSNAQGDTTDPGTNSGGTVNEIDALLTINGGAGEDVLDVDDTGDSNANLATLTGTRLTGLDMGNGQNDPTAGIEYDALEQFNINLGTAGDVFTIVSTHIGATRLEARGGEDTINIRTISGETTVIGDGLVTEQFDDIINVGSQAGVNRSNTGGDLDGIGAALLIEGNGQSQFDVLNVDDSIDPDNEAGELTATTITGLGMATAGITYSGIEILNITLGTGNNPFHIASTHIGSTDLNAGPGLDTVTVQTIAGGTNIAGDDDDDQVLVNVFANHGQTFLNGIGALLDIDGQEGSDDVIVYFAGMAHSADHPISIIEVHDTGIAGNDELDIYGTDNAAVADRFLLRQNFVALLPQVAIMATETAERVSYDGSMNGEMANGLVVNAGLEIFAQDGDDSIVLDDNATTTLIHGGLGIDSFQIGQMFQSTREFPRIPFADDEFVTIETTRGYLSNGNSHDTVIDGDDGNDEFTVYHNTAALALNGGDGDDIFTVRAFALAGSQTVDPNQQVTNLDGGQGADSVFYTANALVNIDGGAGIDTVVIVGTEFSDTFEIRSGDVTGAGLTVEFVNSEILQVDGLEGNDFFRILSTGPGLTVEIFGGLGSDTFVIGENGDLSGIRGELRIEGGIDPDSNRTLIPAFLYVGEIDPNLFVPPNNSNLSADETEQVDVLNVFNQASSRDDTGTVSDTRITGLGMAANAAIVYANTEVLRIELGSGNDRLLVFSTNGGYNTVNSADGDDQVFVQSLGGPTFIDTGAGNDTVNVGTAFDAGWFDNAIDHGGNIVGGTIDQISALLTLNTGAGDDTLNLDDSGDMSDAADILTGTTYNDADFNNAIVQILTIANAAGGQFSIQVGAGPVTDLLDFSASAADVKAALLALELPSVYDVIVNRADNSFVITFLGDETIADTDLTLTSNSDLLVADNSGMNPTIDIVASAPNLTQVIIVDAAGGAFSVMVGDELVMFSLSAGADATTFRDALITAIRSTGLILSAEGLEIGVKDVLVNQINDTYFVSYLGLLRGAIGEAFGLSVEPVSFSVRAENSGAASNHDLRALRSAYFEALREGLTQNSIELSALIEAVKQPTAARTVSAFASSSSTASASASVRLSGIYYYNVDTLNLDLTAQTNTVLNVQGTSAVTNVFGNAGDEDYFISNIATETLASVATTEFLAGHLDAIVGELNLIAGTGIHSLMISDEASLVGDDDVLITDNPRTEFLPVPTIEVSGLAPGLITYQSAEGDDANFADGITIWTGQGNDIIYIDAIHQRDDVNTYTTLNTGAGINHVTINFHRGNAGYFVVTTEGPFNAYLTPRQEPNIRGPNSSIQIVNYTGWADDDVISGEFRYILFGDTGLEHEFDQYFRVRQPNMNFYLR